MNRERRGTRLVKAIRRLSNPTGLNERIHLEIKLKFRINLLNWKKILTCEQKPVKLVAFVQFVAKRLQAFAASLPRLGTRDCMMAYPFRLVVAKAPRRGRSTFEVLTIND